MAKGLTREELEAMGAKPAQNLGALKPGRVRPMSPEEEDEVGLRPELRTQRADPAKPAPGQPMRVRPLSRDELEKMGFQPKADPRLRLDGASSRMGVGDAVTLGVAQGGTFDNADEIGGAAAHLTQEPGVRLGAAFAPSPDDTLEQTLIKQRAAKRQTERPSIYEGTRNLIRRDTDTAEREQGGAYTAARIATGAATGLIPGTQAKTLVGALATGAVMGGASGIGNSEADLTNPTPENLAHAGRDALVGAGAGAVAGGVGYGSAKAAPTLIRGTGQWFERRGLSQGRRHLTSGTNTLGRNVKALPDEAVEAAYRSGSLLPFSSVKGSAVRLEEEAAEVGARYGGILDTLEAAGVPGPEVDALADKLTRRFAETYETTGSDKSVPNLFQSEAENARAVAPPAGTMGGAPLQRSSRLGLRQAESIKQDLQAKARYGRFEETPLNEARKEVASTYRQAVEDSVDQARLGAVPNSDVDLAAESFVPIKQRFGRIAQARDAAVQGARASGNRSTLGLSEKTAIAQAFATGDPTAAAKAIGGASAMRALANRSTSTVGNAAFWGGRAAIGAGNLAGRIPEGVRAAGGAALGASTERALRALDENPSALGKYARMLEMAWEKSPEDLGILSDALEKEDPQYRWAVGAP